MRRILMFAIPLALVVGTSTPAQTGSGDGRDWVAETIEPGRILEVSPDSLALDSTGNPHAAFGSSQLRYASDTGGGWQVEVVDDTPGVAKNTSLALDAADKAHIAYWDEVNNRLLYTTNKTGTWVTRVVYAGGGEGCSIGLDTAGNAHVASVGPDGVQYSTNETGSWATETSAADGRSCALVVESTGRVAIAYDNLIDFRVVRGRAGNWTSELISPHLDLLQDLGGQFSDVQAMPQISDAEIDGQDAMHVVFDAAILRPQLTVGGARGYRATDKSGEWVVQQFVRGDLSGSSPSIALDAVGEPHVSYTGLRTTFSGTGLELEYQPPGGLEQIDARTDGSAIAVASDGTVHVLSVDGDVKHFSGSSGSFSTSVVLTQSFRGTLTSMQLADDDDVHVMHTTTDGLVYTTNESGGWVSQTIDAEVSGPSYLALDANGDAHVAYGVHVGGDFNVDPIRYATNASGNWVVETLDSLLRARVGGIHVDSGGTVHVGYSARNGMRFDEHEVRYATGAAGNWSIETVAAGDVAIATFGVNAAEHAHFAYLTEPANRSELIHTTNSTGSWVSHAFGFGPIPTDTTIAFDAAGAPHIVVRKLDGFNGSPYGLLRMTNATSTWTTEDLFDGDNDGTTPSTVFDASGALQIVHTQFLPDDLIYASSDGVTACRAIIDTGSGGGREFSFDAFTVNEAQTSVTIGVSPTGNANVGSGPSLAIASNGDLYATYHDSTLGGLKLAVRSNAPTPAEITVDYTTKSGGADGTATAGQDYTKTSGTLSWRVGDTASKSFVIPLSPDAEYEGNETVTLELSNPTSGAILGTLNPVILTIEDDDGPDLPDDAVASFVLPKKFGLKLNEKKPEKSKLVISGFIDLGPAPPNLTGPATLRIGSLEIAIPGLEQLNPTSFRYRGDGLTFQMKISRVGSSKGKFKIVAKRDFDGLLFPSTVQTLAFAAGTVDGQSRFISKQGQYKLQKVRGDLLEPAVFPYFVKSKLGGAGKDSLSIRAGLARTGDAPAAAPDVHVAFGPTFTFDIASGDFTKKGDTFRFKGAKGGITSLVLDFKKEVVTIVGKNLDLGAFPEGPQPVVLTLRIGEDERVVALRMVRKGKSLKY